MLRQNAWVALGFSIIGSVGCGEVATGGLPLTCSDGILNGSETEVDCGRPCKACTADDCEIDSECSSGHCLDSACVECIEDTECVGVTPNPAGCNLERCEANACTSTPRHDGTTFQVDPMFTAETNLSGAAAAPVKAIWDGTSFLVVYHVGNDYRAKHVAPDGTVLDSGFLLDAGYGDIAPFNGGYVVATTEPADATYPSNWIAVHQLSTTGTVTVAKDMALWDPGTNCQAGLASHMAAPQIASTGLKYIVTARVQCGFLIRGVFGGSGAPAVNIDPTLYKPYHERIAGGPAGFAMVNEEIRIGMGASETWGQTWTTAGAASGTYTNKDPWTLADNANGCCVRNVGIVSGASSFLFTSTRRYGEPRFRVMNPNGMFASEWTTFAGVYDPYMQPPMTFDGANYLVVPTKESTFLPGHRINAAGVRLDTNPIKLTPDDAATEGYSQLASNGAGRQLIAYSKAPSNNVYIRTFSTCP